MPVSADKTFWTDERVTLLGELVAENLTASEIADEISSRIGRAVTRNAVIGKVGRSGMKLSRPPNTGPGRPRVRKPYVRKWRARSIPVVVVEIPRPPTIEEVAISQRRSVLELTNNTCRWPYGDPSTAVFFFCGGPADLQNGQPYCPAHTALSINRRPR
jgi:GcrA cell cycle regulator